MSLTSDDFSDFVSSDPEDDETVPLGDALAAVAVDVEVDAVDAVRDVREQIYKWMGSFRGLQTPPLQRSSRSSENRSTTAQNILLR